jgi:flavin-dependent dehydrogenase
MSRDADVIVVGGGPAGASTAVRLARLGLGVTLVDRARFPREKPCAEYLGPEALRHLEGLDVLGAVEGLGGVRLSGMVVRSPSGSEFGARFEGVGVPRRDLDSILLDHARAAGVRVVEGFRVLRTNHEDTKDTKNPKGTGGRVTGIEGRDDTGTLRVLRAFLVIGSDGLRSTVARRIGGTRRAWSPMRYACVAHFGGVAGVSDQVEMHVTPRGYVGIADVGQGHTSVAMVAPAERMQAASGDPAAFLEQWIASHSHLAERFRFAERLTPARVTGPFATFPRRVAAPGAALVGDAAGFLDPITGQGVASALRGAEILAPFAAESVAAMRLGDTRTADRALAAYARAHARSFRLQWLVDRIIAFVVARPALMDHAARALSVREGLADRLLGVTSGLRPTREVFAPSFLAGLLLPARR